MPPGGGGVARASLGALAATTATAAFAGYEYDEGFRRMVRVYSYFGPLVLHYRFVEAKLKLQAQISPDSPPTATEIDAAYTPLHHLYADGTLAIIRDLKGFYTKFGQTLAGRGDMIPEVYTSRLRTLEDACPPRDAATIRTQVAAALGLGDDDDEEAWRRIFVEWRDTPVLGAASIGQVHWAKLNTTNVKYKMPGNTSGEVAVKVMDPEAERLFRSDLKTARAFCRVLAPEQVIIFDEIERQFMTEFNYIAEVPT
jgi:aarF domain-containing kinase